jgi:hypothetical protein
MRENSRCSRGVEAYACYHEGDFTNAVATGLWLVRFGPAFHTLEAAHRAVATSPFAAKRCHNQTPMNTNVVVRQIPVPIASRPHCKHLPRMTSGIGPGLIIPDLWQQEAVRSLQPPHLTILAGSGTTSYGA